MWMACRLGASPCAPCECQGSRGRVPESLARAFLPRRLIEPFGEKQLGGARTQIHVVVGQEPQVGLDPPWSEQQATLQRLHPCPADAHQTASRRGRLE